MLDSDPTLKNSKLPPLRRAAIHFLSLLIKEATRLVYDRADVNRPGIFPLVFVRRMSATLSYISSTDEDSMVRIMAREAKKAWEHFKQQHLDCDGLKNVLCLDVYLVSVLDAVSFSKTKSIEGILNIGPHRLG